MSIVEFVESVYRSVRIDCNDRAYVQVLSAAKQLQRHMGPVLIADLSEDLILLHLSWMRERKLAAASINRRRGHLMTIWKTAYKRKLNQHNFWAADVPTVRQPKRRPVATSLTMIEEMLQQADRVQIKVRRPFGPKAWRALILLLYYTGLRITAALSLRRADLHGRLLIVPAEVQKDAEEMAFQLPTELANLLHALPRPQVNGLDRDTRLMLIPWPWRMDAGAKMLAKYIIRPAGLPDDRRLKFHAIRRTVATLVYAEKGVEVARQMLGHSDAKTTERYIADPSTVDPRCQANLSPCDVLPRVG